MIKKYIFTHLCCVEKTEHMLTYMERKGYRLFKVEGNTHYFVQSSPKEVQFFLSYKTYRGPQMGTWELSLLSNHHANPIKSKRNPFIYYRIVNKNNLNFLKDTREDFLNNKIKESIVIDILLIIPICFSLLMAFNDWQNLMKEGLILSIILLVVIVFFIYHLILFYIQNKKVKRIKNKYQKIDS